MASSAVPGNENAISGLINGLTRWGANVVHKGNAKVHVSGHASAGELVYCYNVVKPKNVMPVHGEWRHLQANADLAIATGVPKDHVVIAEDGVVVDLIDGHAKIVGKVAAGNIYVDAQTVGGVTEVHLKDRRTLAEEGVVTVLCIVDADSGQLADPPDFMVRGFAAAQNAFDGAVPIIEKTLKHAASEGIGDAIQLEQMLAREISRWSLKAFRRRPLIIPIVIDA
jgi:ribonuclease J